MHVLALASIGLTAAGAFAMVIPHPRSPRSTANTSITSSSGDFTGRATYFFQMGMVGACGAVNSDSSFIAAISLQRYANYPQVSPLCGHTLTLTDTDNNKSVTVTVADACPTCGENDLDLSEGAFRFLENRAEIGIIPIMWHFDD